MPGPWPGAGWIVSGSHERKGCPPAVRPCMGRQAPGPACQPHRGCQRGSRNDGHQQTTWSPSHVKNTSPDTGNHRPVLTRRDRPAGEDAQAPEPGVLVLDPDSRLGTTVNPQSAPPAKNGRPTSRARDSACEDSAKSDHATSTTRGRTDADGLAWSANRKARQWDSSSGDSPGGSGATAASAVREWLSMLTDVTSLIR